MDDEGFELPQGTGTYIVLGAVCLTLLLRTNGEAFPTGLDIIVAMLFGGLALALVKLASYTFREYILDLLQSGEATTQVVGGATQTPKVYVPSDSPASGAKTSPPSKIPYHMSGNFLVYNNKQVRLSNEEIDELAIAINMSTKHTDNNRTWITSSGLYSKLENMGLASDNEWTDAGLTHFGINVSRDRLASS